MAAVHAPLLLRYPYQQIAPVRNPSVGKHLLNHNYVMPPYIETEIHRRQMLSRGPYHGYGWQQNLQSDPRLNKPDLNVPAWPYNNPLHYEQPLAVSQATQSQPTSKYYEHVMRTLERRSSGSPVPSDLDWLRANPNSKDTCTPPKEGTVKEKARSLHLARVSPKVFEERVKESNLLHLTQGLAEEVALSALYDESETHEKSSNNLEEFWDCSQSIQNPYEGFCGYPATQTNSMWRNPKPDNAIVKCIWINICLGMSKNKDLDEHVLDIANEADYEDLRRESVEYLGLPDFHGAIGDLLYASSSDTGYASFPRDLDLEDLDARVEEV